MPCGLGQLGPSQQKSQNRSGGGGDRMGDKLHLFCEIVFSFI
jgi:hypothetical protein